MAGYKDLIVWQKTKNFCVGIYKLTAEFPSEERFGLVSQLRRAAVSILSNIAEGSERRTRKDQNQFYAVASGSAAEVEAQLSLCEVLYPHLQGQIKGLESDLVEIMKMTARLRNPADKLTTKN